MTSALDALVEHERATAAAKEAARQRKREIKRLMRQQERRGRTGGHDRTGTRVRDDTPLPRPQQPSPESEALRSDTDPRMLSVTSSAPSSLPQAPEQALPSRAAILSPMKNPHKRKRNAQRRIVRNEGHVLGRGAFGTVYMGLDTVTGELVAVKEIVFKDASQDMKEQISRVAKEIQLMKRLEHDNIVRYLGAGRRDTLLQIFMEYVPGGSLRSIVDKFGRLAERVSRRYIGQMLAGLAYLHGEGVVHLDVKGDNALLGVTGEVKLADFGASEGLEEVTKGRVAGTPYFMAPEVVKGVGTSAVADVWSLGISALELLTGAPPLSNIRDPYAVMFQIASSSDPPEVPDFLKPLTQRFVRSCLVVDPRHRPTSDVLANDEWFAEADDSSEEDSPSPAPLAEPPRPTASPPTHKATNQCPTQSAWTSTQSGSTADTATSAAASSLLQAAETARGRLSVAPASAPSTAEGFTDKRAVRSFLHRRCEENTVNTAGDMKYLQELHRLRAKGVLTDFEFQTKKAQLLGVQPLLDFDKSFVDEDEITVTDL
eukprot:TRINITY_DN6211_c0_g1_i1.p1 TRINITY_DN6211_c0_g1~~TRINITY_DN6211_c0_g1_i1.p1  ORF type:complete len:543 (+),score=166.99 TRINITY_DN6211_c0_g1_i1:57-1685(+)